MDWWRRGPNEFLNLWIMHTCPSANRTPTEWIKFAFLVSIVFFFSRFNNPQNKNIEVLRCTPNKWWDCTLGRRCALFSVNVTTDKWTFKEQPDRVRLFLYLNLDSLYYWSHKDKLSILIFTLTFPNECALHLCRIINVRNINLTARSGLLLKGHMSVSWVNLHCTLTIGPEVAAWRRFRCCLFNNESY